MVGLNGGQSLRDGDPFDPPLRLRYVTRGVSALQMDAGLLERNGVWVIWLKIAAVSVRPGHVRQQQGGRGAGPTGSNHMDSFGRRDGARDPRGSQASADVV